MAVFCPASLWVLLWSRKSCCSLQKGISYTTLPSLRFSTLKCLKNIPRQDFAFRRHFESRGVKYIDQSDSFDWIRVKTPSVWNFNAQIADVSLGGLDSHLHYTRLRFLWFARFQRILASKLISKNIATFEGMPIPIWEEHDSTVQTRDRGHRPVLKVD